ncbi:MAG TPA: dethiobiotin synthase [Novosphingobium sp.]|nr:dethiobiotin synthase [Novosphingobium sp.]
MSLRLIVSGTDTGVGKTVIAAGLAAALGARYWKPVQSGLEDATDSEEVARLTAGRVEILPEAWRLVTPCSPHQAARIDGVTITPESLTLPQDGGPLVVEGAGGLLVPLTDTVLTIDQFARWGLPVVLVARTALGTINHSLLSLEALAARGILCAGVIFSGEANPASEQAIISFGQCRHLGRVPRLDPLNAERLAAAFAAHVRTDLLA